MDELIQASEEYLQREDYDKAKRCLKKAVTLAPLRSDLREKLVVVIEHEALGAEVLSGKSRRRVRRSSPSPASKRRKRLAIAVGGAILCLIFLTMAVVVLWENIYPEDFETEIAQSSPSVEETPDPLQEHRRELLEAIKNSSGEETIEKTRAFLATNPPESELLANLVEQMALIQFQMGMEARVKKKYSTAIERFNEAIQTNQTGKDPNGVPFYYRLGEASYLRGCQLESDTDLQRNAEAQREFNAAKKALSRAIDVNPDWLLSYDVMARTHIKLGDTLSGAKFYKEIISRNPGSPEAKKAEGDLRSMGMR